MNMSPCSTPAQGPLLCGAAGGNRRAHSYIKKDCCLLLVRADCIGGAPWRGSEGTENYSSCYWQLQVSTAYMTRTDSDWMSFVIRLKTHQFTIHQLLTCAVQVVSLRGSGSSSPQAWLAVRAAYFKSFNLCHACRNSIGILDLPDSLLNCGKWDHLKLVLLFFHCSPPRCILV